MPCFNEAHDFESFVHYVVLYEAGFIVYGLRVKEFYFNDRLVVDLSRDRSRLKSTLRFPACPVCDATLLDLGAAAL